MAQTKHDTEDKAREAARKLGAEPCQIIESREGGNWNTADKAERPIRYYLETGDDISMIRSWERRAYDGPGNQA